jgi:hypothetical protein
MTRLGLLVVQVISITAGRSGSATVQNMQQILQGARHEISIKMMAK